MPPLNAPLDLRSFVTFRLTRLQAQLNAQAQHILKTHADVGQSEWRVMVLTEDRGTSTMAQVVRDGQMDKAQVSRAASSLVEKGYIEARNDPDDNRQTILSLSKAGRAAHAKILPHMQARQKALLADLSQEDITRLYAILDHLETASARRDL